MNGFDPSKLTSIGLSIGNDGVYVDETHDDEHDIVNADVRQLVSSLKLASKIVGLSIASRGQCTDDDVLVIMRGVVGRVAKLRQLGLQLAGVEPGSDDFGPAFSALTNSMMDAAVGEWQWSRLSGGAKPLSPDMLQAIMVAVIDLHGETPDITGEGINLALVRRLSVVDIIPRLHGLLNFFDFYWADREALVELLARAVIDQAEECIAVLGGEAPTARDERLLIQRLYGVSVGLLCETFKTQANREVRRLRELPELDRCIEVAAHQENGGMSCDHVIQAYRVAINRMLSTSELIIESRRVEPE